MVTYKFYTDEYQGSEIKDETIFTKLATRANFEIQHFERVYTVSGDEKNRNLAICAVADDMHKVDRLLTQGSVSDSDGNIVGKVSSVSVGSVSTSYANSSTLSEHGIDTSAKGTKRRYYDILIKYMSVYRGVSKCL